MLDAARLARAEEIFQELVGFSHEKRRAVLADRCGDDAELRAFVEQLLESDAQGLTRFLETPAVARERFEVDSVDDGRLPERIGRYEIIRKLGEGGMGVVYEARQDHPKRIIALKVIAPGLTSRHLLRRFQQEAEVLGHLQHPGIAHIYEAGIAEVRSPSGPAYEQPYLAMELINGRPLNEYCRARGLGTRERLELLAKVCDAVQHAHQKGVIHRDLKPANIFVVDEDEASHRQQARQGGTSLHASAAAIPKILDFGVARATESDIQAVTMRTDVGQLIGTVPYMSPEQVSGDPKQLDLRSDVYALGVILYELLAERLPIDVRDRSIPEAARMIREDGPSRLSSVSTVFRGDVETIVARAMEKDKERRYQSAAELAADIRRYLRDEPIVARPASAMYQFRKFAKRNKSIVAGIAATFIALVVGVVGMSVFAVRESRQRKLAEELLIESREARDAEAQERQRAEHRFREVHSLAKALIFDLHDGLEKVPGATEAREKLVSTAVQYLDSLTADAGDDAALLQDLAAAHARLGHIRGRSGLTNLGDTKGALESHEKSLALIQRILQLLPDDEQALLGLSRAHEAVGSAHRVLGNTAEATRHSLAHFDIMKQLNAAYPDKPEYRRGIAIAHANIARMEWAAGRLDAALEHMSKCRAFYEGMVEDHPDDYTFKRDLSVTLIRIGEMQRQAGGDAAGALERFQEALRLSEVVFREKPDDPYHREGLAVTNTCVGNVLVDLGRASEALPHYREALQLREGLVSADARDFRARRSLAVSEFSLGNAYQGMKDFDSALTHYRNYERMSADVVALDPNNVIPKRDLAIARQRVANMLTELGRHDEAATVMRESMTAFDELVERDPGDVIVALDAAVVHLELGQILSKLAGQDATSNVEQAALWRDARRCFENCQNRLEGLASEGRLAPKGKQPLEDARKGLADTDRRIAELDGGERAASDVSP